MHSMHQSPTVYGTGLHLLVSPAHRRLQPRAAGQACNVHGLCQRWTLDPGRNQSMRSVSESIHRTSLQQRRETQALDRIRLWKQERRGVCLFYWVICYPGFCILSIILVFCTICNYFILIECMQFLFSYCKAL